ncbi:MAG: flagellar hook basal-body protein [Desulfobacteraceae bacterium]|jgi:flagellar hook protein FlgE
MIASIYSSLSALNTFGKSMQVKANNLANVNTVGFKSSTSTCQDLASQSVSTASGTSQVGRGCTLSDIDEVFDQGPIELTGNSTDLAIEGDGFFVLRRSDSEEVVYSRAGNFHFNEEGVLVNPEGHVVQGWRLDENGERVGSIEDIRLDEAASEIGDLQGFEIQQDGTVEGHFSNGDTIPLYQIAEARFSNPQGLQKAGGNLYLETSESGAGVTGSPGSNGLGHIVSNTLEHSNVDMAREITGTIPLQRGYEANLKVIQTEDEMLGSLLDIMG